MKNILLRSGLLMVLLDLTLLLGCGGGGGVTLPPPGGGSGGGNGGSGGSTADTAVLVNIGGFTVFRDDNAPNPIADQIVSLQLTIESVTLRSSKGDVSLLPVPRRFELSHLASKYEPLVLQNVAQGNYSAIVIGVSNPKISSIDSNGILHENVAASLTSSSAVNTSEIGLDASSTTINLVPLIRVEGGSAVTVTPALQFTKKTPFSIEGVLGRVTKVESISPTSRPNFTIDAGNNGTFKFAWDWWDFVTDFQGFDGDLKTGMTVEVSAEDGAGTVYFYARKVKLEQDDANGVVIEGPALILSPGQLQMLVREVHGPGGATLPLVGKALTVNAGMSTQFRIESDRVDLEDLNFTPTFNALTMQAGQNVRISGSSGNATTIAARQLTLEEQSFDGIAGPVNAGTVSGQFSIPLTLPDESAFTQLTGHTSVMVTLQPSTEKDFSFGQEDCVTCIAGSAVRVRGLLFFSGGKYRLVASHVALN